nr:hypothetical protein [Tanacetum cinerariifolium]
GDAGLARGSPKRVMVLPLCSKDICGMEGDAWLNYVMGATGIDEYFNWVSHDDKGRVVGCFEGVGRSGVLVGGEVVDVVLVGGVKESGGERLGMV